MILMIKPDEQLIDKIINAIDWDEVYNPDRMFSEDDISSITEFLPKEIGVSTGASKCVLIPKLNNFVIKLPFLYCSIGDEMVELQNAPFCGNDYCYAEWEYYTLAKDANIEMFFPETIQYCTYPYHIYLQEKCISEATLPFHPLSKENKEFIDSLPILDNFSYQWVYECYKWYGLEALYKLHHFLKDNNISDFHGDNYGYRRSDNSPVLIDFSGFNY